MADEDLKWNFITNTPEYYDFKLEHKDNVEIKNVTGATYNEETCTYRVTENGKVEYTYIYNIDGIVAEWTESREIKLLKFDIPSEEASVFFVYANCMIFKFEGTDVPLETIEITYAKDAEPSIFSRKEVAPDDKLYSKWYVGPTSFKFTDEVFYLRLVGSWYLVNPSGRTITLEK